MERKPEGGVVFRSVRAEEKEARRYNISKQKAMEILFAKVQTEFEKEEKGRNNVCKHLNKYRLKWNRNKLSSPGNKPQQRKKTISHQEVANLQDGEELYEAVGDDPSCLEVNVTSQGAEFSSPMN